MTGTWSHSTRGHRSASSEPVSMNSDGGPVQHGHRVREHHDPSLAPTARGQYRPVSCAVSSAGASASDGPYQVRCRPLTNTGRHCGHASGPSSGVNA